MTVIETAQAALDWLLADPAHIVAAAATVAALTPTPDPASPAGKLYRVIDIFALNFLHAKEDGPSAGQTSNSGGASAPSGK